LTTHIIDEELLETVRTDEDLGSTIEMAPGGFKLSKAQVKICVLSEFTSPKHVKAIYRADSP
jgi:hypothetical protein